MRFFIEVLLSMIMDNFDSPFLYNRPSLDIEGVKKAIVYKLIFLIGRSPKEASQRDWLKMCIRDRSDTGFGYPIK